MSELPSISKGPVQINLPIRRTIEILGNQFKLDNIEVRLELEDAIPAINGQYNQLVQVIYNLLDNAQNAILAKKDQRGESPDPDTITIRAFARGQTVQVAIADTGVGIPEHHLDRVYEPFFTTKAEDQGKGLGLTICRQIVRDFGGQIKLESEIGKGTIVTLVFPGLEEAGGAVSG
jgi:signal transduction histidine kinase